MKNIFKITLLAGALTLPQAGGSAWGQQMDLHHLFDNGCGGTGTATLYSPHFENGKYRMGDMLNFFKKAAYEEFLGFREAGRGTLYQFQKLLMHLEVWRFSPGSSSRALARGRGDPGL